MQEEKMIALKSTVNPWKPETEGLHRHSLPEEFEEFA